MTNRRPLWFILLLLGILAAPSLAIGAKPTITYFEADSYTIPAELTGCGFDVLVTPINSKLKLIAFTDQDGNPRVLLLNGANLAQLTNLDTDKTLVFNSSAPAKIFFEPDGTFHALVQGTAVLTIAPGAAPGFPSFAFTRGKLDMITTPDFITVQINDFHGTVQDVCSLLS
jgi:hypothetical protein